MSKGKKIALKVVAGVMACLMVSVGSIGGFVALINNGYISVNNSGNSTEPAFTINKLVDNNQPATSPGFGARCNRFVHWRCRNTHRKESRMDSPAIGGMRCTAAGHRDWLDNGNSCL